MRFTCVLDDDLRITNPIRPKLKGSRNGKAQDSPELRERAIVEKSVDTTGKAVFEDGGPKRGFSPGRGWGLLNDNDKRMVPKTNAARAASTHDNHEGQLDVCCLKNSRGKTGPWSPTRNGQFARQKGNTAVWAVMGKKKDGNNTEMPLIMRETNAPRRVFLEPMVGRG